jgi:DNA-binding XRE family transcriptional regulator
MATAGQADREEKAERLRRARVKAGFKSRLKAAQAAGVSADTYKAHETGRHDFDSSRALRYAQLFGVSLNWLLAGKDERTPTSANSLGAISNGLDEHASDIEDKPLTVPEAKRRLALTLGVDPSSIKIIIEA